MPMILRLRASWIAVLLLVYIQWRTMLLNYYHNGIQWRDTHYSLAELRANKEIGRAHV